MKVKLLLIIFSALVASLSAKPAEDYFHHGAALYIEGRMQQAKIEVEEGLRQFPEDTKLSALSEQLKNLEDQQKQDNQNQSEGGQEGDEKEKNKEKNQKSGDNNPQEDKQEEPQENDKQENEKEDQGNSGQQENEQDQAPKDSLGQGEAPPEQGEMSEEEAKRLLDNYKNDEKQELKNLKKKVGRRGKPVKDW